MRLSARLPEFWRELNSSKPILDSDTAMRRKGLARIAYLIESENSIDILGVFHGALNIDRYLL